uniref:Uncharacterized protein n=2 Tax=Alexandrium monilatum TaxID=311494 RepID=A0A7S4QBZ0_9DINO|mmetsp:Transcript_52950/g.166325  ORF Transcript_52950/g.166325 Transcript_52950/m.166325 type:complete len:166 (+) Transcript_52950:816-1313(+)
MAEPHPTLGMIGGHSLYGINSFAVHAPAMVTAAEPCAEAARRNDARDKYFAISVRESNLDAGKRLAGELPAFEAAKSALAAAASELSSALAAMPACANTAGAVAARRNATAAAHGPEALALSGQTSGPTGRVEDVLSDYLDVDTAELLVGSTRAIVRAARKELSQ